MIAGSIFLVTMLTILPYFFKTIEERKGIQVSDWLLNQIPAHDMSTAIFTIIWGMAALAFYRAISKPSMYVTYVWTYAFIVLIRMITITCVQLDPPVGLIQLTDPLTGIFYGHASITKDLFFSGHTATLFLIFLTLEKRWDKIIGILAVITVAFLLLVQHVHYSFDVIMAPVAVYPIYRLVVSLLSPNTAKTPVLAEE